MTRKIVSCTLLASLAFFIGCYNNETITRGELNADRKRELKQGADQLDIRVFTDSSEYSFSSGSYRVQADTLAGFGVQKAGGYEVAFKGYIQLSAITVIKTEEFSLAKTILVVAIPGALIGGFFYAWGVSAAKH